MSALTTPSRSTAYALLVLSICLWGGTGVVAKLTLGETGVFTLLFWRFCLAALLLTPAFLLDRHRQPLHWRDTLHLMVLGFFGVVLNIGLFFVGISQASILDASLITALSPAMVVIGGWLFLKERLHIGQLVGLALATFGIIIAVAGGGGSGQHSLLGNVCILGAVLAMTIYTIGTKELAHRLSAVQLVAVSFMVGIVCFAPLAMWEMWHGSSIAPLLQWPAAAGVLYLALGSSVLAYLCHEWAIRQVPASVIGGLAFLQPFLGMLLAVAVLHEGMTWQYAIGGAVTLAGMVLVLDRAHLPHLGHHHIRHHHRA